MREMKDSGVEWIGEIPITWKCCKQKYEVTLLNGRAYKDNEFEEDGKYPILRVGNLFSNPVWYSSSLELPQDKYCNSGDLLYSWSMSYSPIIWEGPKVIYHYHIWKTILSDSVYKKFVYYYMKALTDALKAEIHETTMGFITMGVMNNSYFAFPTKSEQRSIANYLDQKCSEIDAITKDIQTQIDTLEQYKRSVITEAVTKGLDPDVEMKDSGVEWIGEVPVEWNIIQLKYLLNEPMKYGATESGVDYDESLIRYIRITDIDSSGNLKETGKLSLTPQQAFGFILKNNTILYARSGGTVGKTFLYTTDCGKAAFAGYLISAVANPKIALPKWIMYYSNSNAYWNWVNSIFSQATIQNIGADKYSKMPLPLPDIALQKTIISYLNDKCFKIDALIKDKQTQLTTLADYKKSLIYEYVTGKKEVPVE